MAKRRNAQAQAAWNRKGGPHKYTKWDELNEARDKEMLVEILEHEEEKNEREEEDTEE